MHARHCPARLPVSQRWVRHRAIPLTHLPWRLKPQQWAPFTAFGLLRLQTDPNNPADPETQAQINRTIIQVWLQPAGLMICVMPAGCLDEQHCSTDPRKPTCRMRGQLCPATLQHSGPVGWYALQRRQPALLPGTQCRCRCCAVSSCLGWASSASDSSPTSCREWQQQLLQ